MAFLSSMNVVGSGLTAQQLRLDVVSENITNRTTTRTEGGGAYRRKMVVFEAEGEISENIRMRWWHFLIIGERSLRHRGRRSGN